MALSVERLCANVTEGPLRDEQERKRQLPAKPCTWLRPDMKRCRRERTGNDGLCTFHANHLARTITRATVNAIMLAGFTVTFVDFCENSETPGLLGYYAGVTNHTKKMVRISTKKTTEKGIRNRNVREIARILQHELKHVITPEWDCGNRLVI